MTPAQAVILGIVQGLTEFLPVSSSGHLVAVQAFFQLPPSDLLFDATVHAATLVAICIYFRQQILTISRKQIQHIIIATLPIICIAVLFESFIEQAFNSTVIVSLGLLITTIILIISRYAKPPSQSINAKSSIGIGLAQALAIIPGISRSGSTITAALMQGISRKDAFSFSFLMSIPSIAGAFLYQLLKLDAHSQLITPINVLGFISALTTGIISLTILKWAMRQEKLHYFALYTASLSLLLLTTSIN